MLANFGYDIDGTIYIFPGTINSPYSVEDINKGATPWLVVKVDKTIKAIFDARTTYEEFLEKVRKLPIDIYVREEKNQ